MARIDFLKLVRVRPCKLNLKKDIVEYDPLNEDYLLVKTLYGTFCWGADIGFFLDKNKRVNSFGHEVVVEVCENKGPFFEGERLVYYYQEGGFSEYQLLKWKDLFFIKVSPHYHLRRAVFGEPLIAVVRALIQYRDLFEAKKDILIIGGGPIGVIFYYLIQKLFGLEPHLYEINPYRKEKLQSRGLLLQERLSEEYDIIVDAFGNNLGDENFHYHIFDRALSPGGSYIAFGHPWQEVNLPLDIVSIKGQKILGIETDMEELKKSQAIIKELFFTLDFSWLIDREVEFKKLPQFLEKFDFSSRNFFKIGVRM